MRTPILLFLTLTALGPVALGQHEEHGNAYSGPEEGLGRVHMDTSCSPAVAAEFNRALALLHNFGTCARWNGSRKSQRTIPSVPWRIGVRR